MKIGDEILIHGYIDEIRKDTIIVRNDGGYFGTVEAEIRPMEKEQKIGHWIKSDIPNEKYVCSECGGCCWYYDYQACVARSKYCPNCGAKMESEE